MVSRIALAAILVAASMPAARAQSAAATNFQTKPMQPASGKAQKNTKTPTQGLRWGQDAFHEGDTITIKRIK